MNASRPHALPEPSLAAKLVMPAVMMVAFWVLALVLWRTTGQVFFIFNFGYIGMSVGVGMAVYALLPRQKKVIGRRLTLLLVGLYMFGLVGVIFHENIQMEGFFLYLLAGVSAAATIHYMVAKIFGPLVMGRAWCGWACWTVMVLDLLPFTTSPGRLPGRWGWLRYAHFGVSLLLVLVLWFGLDYRLAYTDTVSNLAWMLGGNGLYFGSGIMLAYALKDNRAFCKYLCPITTVLKIGAHVSLLKIGGKAEQCTGCEACTHACPMDVHIPAYISAGKRVLSTECILCQACLNACPTKTLKITAGFDAAVREHLVERQQSPQEGSHEQATRV